MSTFTAEATPAVPRLARWINRRSIGRHTPEPFVRFHTWVYRFTAGRIGHGMVGAPCLVLTTTGRRSGLPRSSVLVYARAGARWVVVASNDGADHDPQWFRNIQADPAVAVRVGRRTFPGRARTVDRAAGEYARLWDLVNAPSHDRYAQYQAGTARPIPLVVIEPACVSP